MNFFKSYQNIHLIGIGGVGVSAIAEVLIGLGKTISGSDMRSSSLTRHLQLIGAEIHLGHDSTYAIGKDLIIYSAAVDEENSELKYARQNNITVITRAEALGFLMQTYPYSIAVSGTHGKTTTTAMLATIFTSAQLDPTILVGGELDSIGGNTRLGSGEHLITEACEYKDSFLAFHPNCALVLNIEEDHLDYFDDLEDIVDSFTTFAQKVPKNGYLVLNFDDYPTMRLVHHVNCHIVTFGFHEDSTFCAKNVRFNEKGDGCFDVIYEDQILCSIILAIPGRHNISNALAAIATAYCLGVSPDTIAQSLKTFVNAKRRFEIIGVHNDITLVDDYAHHPNEVKALLQGAKNFPHSRIIGIFQPHTFTRTHELLHEFSTAFNLCDKLILADIYAAREPDTKVIHSRDLAQLIKNQGQEVIYLSSFDEILSYLKEILQPGDLVLSMGAGNINEVLYTLNQSYTNK